MKKISTSNIIFGCLLVLLIIPKTRTLIQVNMQKVMGMMSSTKVIAASEQKVITQYTGQLKSINGNENVNFSNLKGKIVFINFWATWCPPCIAEMQSLQELYNIYQNDVVFLFVTNEDSEKTNAFLRKHNYTVPCFNPKTALPKEFEHTTIPTTFIVNKQGKIVVKKNGTVNWNSEQVHGIVNQLLKE